MQTLKTNPTKIGLSTFSIVRQWTKSAYKCTRQIVSEKLGNCNKTVDPELDSAIEVGYI
jgi:hypothetical protein